MNSLFLLTVFAFSITKLCCLPNVCAFCKSPCAVFFRFRCSYPDSRMA